MTYSEIIVIVILAIVLGIIFGFLISRILLKRRIRKLGAKAYDKLLSDVKLVIDGKEYNLKEGTVKKVRYHQNKEKDKVVVPKKQESKSKKKIAYLTKKKMPRRKKGILNEKEEK